MKVLYQAIYTKYAAGGDFKTNTTTGSDSRFHFVEAPEKESYPYAVYGPVHEMPEYYFNGVFEDELIQFDIYSDNSSAVECLNLYENLKTMFDDVRLTVTGYTHYKFERVSMRGPFKAPDSRIWHLSVDYNALVEAP